MKGTLFIRPVCMGMMLLFLGVLLHRHPTVDPVESWLYAPASRCPLCAVIGGGMDFPHPPAAAVPSPFRIQTVHPLGETVPAAAPVPVPAIRAPPSAPLPGN